jgi:transcriptional regulator with XRE-family HTH domain
VKPRCDESELPGRIRYWREKAGLSPGQLAEKIGVDRSAISHWEAGDFFPATPNLIRVAVACGIDMRMFWAPLDLGRVAG